MYVLLGKAKDGTLRAEELQFVQQVVRDGDRRDNLYTAIHILGISGNRESAELVEPYLRCPDDPMLSRISLEVLCGYWGLSDKYLADVREFMAGVAWDEDFDVRQTAIGLAGRFAGNGHDSQDLGRRLLSLAEDDQDDPLMRESAVRALAVSIGDPRDSLPPASRRTPMTSAWTAQVLQRARQAFA